LSEQASQTRPVNGQNLTLLVILPLIWALHFAFIKKIDADANVIAALTALLGGLCGFYFLALVIRRELFAFSRKRLVFFTIAGLLAYVLPLAAELLVAPRIDAGVLTMIVSLTPVFTVAVAVAMRLVKPVLRLLLSIAVGAGGIVLLLLDADPEQASPMIWIIVACTVPFFYAIDALYIEHFWPNGLNALQLAFGETLIAFAIMMVVFMGNGGAVSELVGWFYMKDFLILCLVTTIEVALFFYLVGQVGALIVNIASYLVLPAGFFWGWLMFDEVINLASFACGICALMALLLVSSGSRKAPQVA